MAREGRKKMAREGTEMIWELIKPYFSRKEKWGNPDKMSPELLTFLYLFRKTFTEGVYMLINCGYEQRKNGGGHPDGRAVDCRIVRCPFEVAEEKLREFIQKYNLEKYIALGVYPEWGEWRRPGFHIEIEKSKQSHPRRWGATYARDADGSFLFKDKKLIQKYIDYDLALKNREAYEEELLT